MKNISLMKKIILFICLIYITSFSAQSIYEISWEEGISLSAASLTIEVGDSVLWTWTGDSSYTISSLENGSETFDSELLEGPRSSFLHTFKAIGITEYYNKNNLSMKGKIRVLNKLSVEEKFVKNLSFYPNPVKSSLTISSVFKIESYQIHNILGSIVLEGKGGGSIIKINMDRLNSGLYFVSVFTENSLESTLKIAKN